MEWIGGVIREWLGGGGVEGWGGVVGFRGGAGNTGGDGGWGMFILVIIL